MADGTRDLWSDAADKTIMPHLYLPLGLPLRPLGGTCASRFGRLSQEPRAGEL